MAYQPAKICEVIDKIRKRDYVLPAIQREFVWSTEQIENLFDSLMQGYPIGAFLFWEVPDGQRSDYVFYTFLENYHERENRHNEKIDLKGVTSTITAVLDGQQRLTSLYIGLKGSYAYRLAHKRRENPDAYPERKLYLDLLSFNNKSDKTYNFSFRAKTEAAAGNDEIHFWYEVGNILEIKSEDEIEDFCDFNLPTDASESKIQDNATDDESNSKVILYTKDQQRLAKKTLKKLFSVICDKESLTYYSLRSDDLDQVLNIFVRVNSGGTPLSYSDLLLSIATAEWKDIDAREEISQLVDELNRIGHGFNFDKDFILKASLVLSDDIKDIEFRIANFRRSNMAIIERNWPQIKHNLRLAVELVASMGFSYENLTSNNAIIPIALYIKNLQVERGSFITNHKMAAERQRIRKWLTASLIKGVFGSSSDTTLKNLRKILNQHKGETEFPLDDIIAAAQASGRPITFSDEDIESCLDLKYGKPATQAVLMALYSNYDFTQGFAIDHIFPKSNRVINKQLTEAGLSTKQIEFYKSNVNNITNLEILPPAVNGEKYEKDYGSWLKEYYGQSPEKFAYYCHNNYIPIFEPVADSEKTYSPQEFSKLLEKVYSPKSFSKFLKERQKLLRDALKATLLRSLAQSQE